MDVSDKLGHTENVLYGDVLSKIMGFLQWMNVLQVRCVASQWRDAATNTQVVELHINSRFLTERLCALSRCIPKLQSLKVDQNSEIDDTTFSKVAQFLHLKHISCLHTNLQFSFPHIVTLRHLESLNLHGNGDIEFELSQLQALSQLRDLRCINNRSIKGDIKDLLPLSTTLVIVDISGCAKVTGDLCDLAGMPLLEWLGLSRTLVGGDLRNIQPGDFASLQGTGLDHRIYGAREFKFVCDASEVMRARHQLMKDSTYDCPIYPFMVGLAHDSPDYHERIEQRLYTSEKDPPFNIEMVFVGDRWGWRWSNYLGGFCDVHWLDPEPKVDDPGHDAYSKEVKLFQKDASFFSGLSDPPTREEYHELCAHKLL
uniref:F-box domain-containing protein n=1 Tax=Odontella aurita TaxID=265563 RepID=A0A7S4NIE3_9STRA|mmetsp:Transcript_9621/g.28841  ORF Transcript_9621/g.28841 Transcript_9621/m.28841 type:complete len:370 (+) Transcript_9621:190-1299(+)